jgi:hypothetical protein
VAYHQHRETSTKAAKINITMKSLILTLTTGDVSLSRIVMSDAQFVIQV